MPTLQSPRCRPGCRASSRTFAMSIGLAVGFTAVAQPVPYRPGLVPPVVVTASRFPEVIDDALADVTVIEHDVIVRAGPGGVAALLQRQPGVEITRNGGPASVSGLFIRGTNRGQAVVLVDGVRVGSASTGAATLEAIPLEDIERIEILRGPASGLYGADALGGVVQIFTRRATGATTASVRGGYGSDDTREFGASASAATGGLRFGVSTSHRASRGFNAVTDPADFNYNPDRDGYRGESGAANLAWTWRPGHALAANWMRSRVNAAFDGGPDHDDRTVTVVETAQIESRNQLGTRWLSHLRLAESTDDSVSKTGFGDFPFRTRMRQYAWQNDLTLPAGTLILGVERREERIGTDAAFAVTARDTDAALALYQWRSGAHAFQANVRRDDAGGFGARTTGGARYGYQWSPAWQASVAAGSAFRVPSFNDLYYPGFSNPRLRPETAENVEARLTYGGRSELVGMETAWRAGAVGYRNRVSDLIVFVCDAAFDCAPQNVDRAILTGLTLTLDATRGPTTVAASLDLQDPRDERTHRLLPRRARQHGALSVSHRAGPVILGAEIVAAARRFEDPANLRPLAGYGILNLTAEWVVARGWSLLVRGDNVLDRDYELAANYANGGARVFAALRWQAP
ncbi:MAG: TonB-dependent receptor [Casimicrobiaceae bacterium]